MASTIDLQQLAVDRHKPSANEFQPKRHVLTRFVFPLVVVLLFAGLIAWAMRDSLLPAQRVTVVPVVVTRAEVRQEGTPLFRAAGWLEPRPTAYLASALTDGIVEELLVVEGMDVKSNQPVARLIRVDAEIALGNAQAQVSLMEAEVARARAATEAAAIRFRQPLHLIAAVAEAESALAKAKSDLGNLPYAIDAAQSRIELARLDYEGKKAAGAAIAGRSLQRSHAEYDTAIAKLKELQAREPVLQSDVDSLMNKLQALSEQLKLKTDETRQLAEAEADVRSAQARLQQATLAVQAAELRLERMTVRAPVAGRVLNVVAQPGRRVAGQESMAGQESSTIVQLYDPQSLQVRADVRLEDVAQVQLGQPVQIETAAIKEPLVGTVLSLTGEADIQKNTLEVKVALTSPPDTVRPEMLAQLTFLAPPTPQSESEGSKQEENILIPRQFVVQAEGGSYVWVADRVAGVARLQSVELGKAGTDELVEVTSGLAVTDKLISGGRESVEDGGRITVTGEDQSVGVANRGASAAAIRQQASTK